MERVQVRNQDLICVFFDIWVDLGSYGFYVQAKSRGISNNLWPSFYNTVYWLGYPWTGLGMETTNNNKLNVIAYGIDYNTSLGLLHRSYDGNSWDEPTVITNDEIN